MVVFFAELAAAGVLLLLPLPIPAMIPLVILASIALELRGLGWNGVGLNAENALRDGLTGLLLGLLVASLLPLAVGGGGSGSDFLLLDGNGRVLIAALLLALALSAASEMLFRGYVITAATRIWGANGTIVGLLAGALVSTMALQPTTIGEAFGSFLLALGYGAFYLASGRRLLLPIAVHVTVDGYPIVVEFLGG